MRAAKQTLSLLGRSPCCFGSSEALSQFCCAAAAVLPPPVAGEGWGEGGTVARVPLGSRWHPNGMSDAFFDPCNADPPQGDCNYSMDVFLHRRPKT